MCGSSQDSPIHSTAVHAHLDDTCAEIDAQLRAMQIAPKRTKRILKESGSASSLRAPRQANENRGVKPRKGELKGHGIKSMTSP